MILLPSAAIDDEGAAVERGARRRGGERVGVADAQPMRSKTSSPAVDVRPSITAPRGGALVERMKRAKASTSGPNGFGRGRRVLGIGDRVERRDGVAVRGVLGREERAGDPHLVEVGVRREGEQAGVLVLPAEAADAHDVPWAVGASRTGTG